MAGREREGLGFRNELHQQALVVVGSAWTFRANRRILKENSRLEWHSDRPVITTLVQKVQL